jgi:integrase
VNHFLSWAKKEGEVGEAEAQLPRLPTRDIEILSRDEIAKLENTARNERDKLIIRVLADTGVRVAQLCGLRTADLLERDRRWYLRVRGEGGQGSPCPGP